ncbi:amidohydrolase family protein [Membranihabitans maritimus]|uniref:amidohydrolase family protein n=1 Tax=Membranihabitans maritimus TaxID=2904244 RepID=UPI001F28F7AD|nr:amidohydrolase family protein [Membranihabitans maritimus]
MKIITETSKKILFTTFQIIVFFLVIPALTYSQNTISNNSLTEVNPPGSPGGGVVQAIVGARLIDGLGGEPIENSVVILEGNRIKTVGVVGDIEIPENAKVVNAEGQTLLPGLVDAHFHSVNNNEVLNQFLRNGVTSMRDPGHPFRFYQALDFAKNPVPRMFLTGSHLDGYPGVYKDHALLVKDSGHAREMVHQYAKNGSSGIKIYFRLPLKYYEPIVQAADFHGIPVFAHLELVDADDAIRAGVSGIEHVSSFGTAIAEPSAAEEFRKAVERNSNNRREGRYKLWAGIDLEADRVKDVIKLAADKKIFFCPTLATFERQSGGQGVEDYHVQAFENMLKFVGMAHDAGVTIVTGSHTHSKYVEMGWAYQREMELLVKAGLSPDETIKASTSMNAKYFRSSERIGSIEPGKMADLILVEGNPSSSISEMYNIRKVMINGKWVDNSVVE